MVFHHFRKKIISIFFAQSIILKIFCYVLFCLCIRFYIGFFFFVCVQILYVLFSNKEFVREISENFS
jgi:hypothetical protein